MFVRGEQALGTRWRYNSRQFCDYELDPDVKGSSFHLQKKRREHPTRLESADREVAQESDIDYIDAG